MAKAMIVVELLKVRKGKTIELWTLESVEKFVEKHSCVINAEEEVAVMQATVEDTTYVIHAMSPEVAQYWAEVYNGVALEALEEEDWDAYEFYMHKKKKVEAFC